MLIIIALQATNGTSMEFVSYVYQNDEVDDISHIYTALWKSTFRMRSWSILLE